MPPVPEIQVHLVNHANAILDLLKIVLPGVIGMAGALIGVWLGGHRAARTARKSWEWDAKRNGYLGLFSAAEELAFQAGLVMMAVNRRAGDEMLAEERQKLSSALAKLNAAAVVSRVTASVQSRNAINDLIRYLRDELNPFLQEGVPDPVVWISRNEPALAAKLETLEVAVSADLSPDA